MIYCANCGTANRDGSRFCNECGMRLGAPVTCSSCSAQNVSTARFCSNCGNPLAFMGTNNALDSDKPSAVLSLAEEALDADDASVQRNLPVETATLETELVSDVLAFQGVDLESEIMEDSERLSKGALPSWLMDGEDDAQTSTAILSREIDDALEEPASNGVGTGIKGDESGIILSSSLTSSYRSVDLVTDLPPIAGAGEIFEASLSQPWDVLQGNDGAVENDSVKKKDAEATKKAEATRVVLLVVLLLLLSASVISFVYVAQPNSLPNIGELGQMIQREATTLFSRFIK